MISLKQAQNTQSQTCKLHPKKICEFYCLSCKYLICEICKEHHIASSHIIAKSDIANKNFAKIPTQKQQESGEKFRKFIKEMSIGMRHYYA